MSSSSSSSSSSSFYSSTFRNQITSEHKKIVNVKRIQELLLREEELREEKNSSGKNRKRRKTGENHDEIIESNNTMILNNDDTVHTTSTSISEFSCPPVKIYNFGDNRLIPDFKIISFVQYYKKSIEMNANLTPADDNLPLINNSRVTKGIFARTLNEWFEEEDISQSSKLKLLNILNNSVGTIVQLPIISNREEDKSSYHKEIQENVSSVGGEEILTRLYVKSTISDYSLNISRFISFDQCVSDCTVFEGQSNRHLFRCPKCNAARYRPCVKTNCANRGKSNCEHLLKDGVPYKQLHYRSLILLINDLVKYETFVEAINYTRKDYRRFYDSPNFGSDIRDGYIPRQNLREMENSFEIWRHKNLLMRSNAKPVNILLSEFTDGLQLFKRRAKDFECIITSIINLPPTYRGKEGIATFLTAVYEGKHDFAEQVIFSDMYVQELQKLYEGFEIKVNGKIYFIQARLVLHIHDTKSAEGVFQLQNCSNNTSGCPYCQKIRGIHDGAKCIYFGHRGILPQNHWSRMIGQSKKCCPRNFYSDNLWFAKETFVESIDQKNLNQIPVNTVYLNQQASENFSHCIPCDGNEIRKQELNKFYSSTAESNLLWYHTGEFDLRKVMDIRYGLKPILYYRHYDFRPYNEYNRVPYETHMADAQQAVELNANKQQSKKNKKLKMKNKLAVNGIKGIWPFAGYKIADFSTQHGPPGIHAITGCVKMLLQIIMGQHLLKNQKAKEGIPINEEEVDVEVSSSEDESSDDDEEEEKEEKETATLKSMYECNLISWSVCVYVRVCTRRLYVYVCTVFTCTCTYMSMSMFLCLCLWWFYILYQYRCCRKKGEERLV